MLPTVALSCVPSIVDAFFALKLAKNAYDMSYMSPLPQWTLKRGKTRNRCDFVPANSNIANRPQLVAVTRRGQGGAQDDPHVHRKIRGHTGLVTAFLLPVLHACRPYCKRIAGLGSCPAGPGSGPAAVAFFCGFLLLSSSQCSSLQLLHRKGITLEVLFSRLYL